MGGWLCDTRRTHRRCPRRAGGHVAPTVAPRVAPHRRRRDPGGRPDRGPPGGAGPPRPPLPPRHPPPLPRTQRPGQCLVRTGRGSCGATSLHPPPNSPRQCARLRFLEGTSAHVHLCIYVYIYMHTFPPLIPNTGPFPPASHEGCPRAPWVPRRWRQPSRPRTAPTSRPVPRHRRRGTAPPLIGFEHMVLGDEQTPPLASRLCYSVQLRRFGRSGPRSRVRPPTFRGKIFWAIGRALAALPTALVGAGAPGGRRRRRPARSWTRSAPRRRCSGRRGARAFALSLPQSRPIAPYR